MKTKIVSAFEKNSEIWAIVRCVCHFVPLITSIVWILYYAFDPSNFIVDYILAPIMIIGWIAALVARPIGQALRTTTAVHFSQQVHFQNNP